MNKTISVNIGGSNYFLEEEAYAKLDAYLSALRSHFAEKNSGKEIVSDIENRIAEKFAEKVAGVGNAVIKTSDVAEIIAELGDPGDIDENGDAGEAAAQGSNVPRRLMRNTDDALIGGVCSGMAAFFGIDPLLVRIAFVVLFFAWGAIIPIYLLLWLIMPEAKTQADKMAMRGERFTVKNLSQAVKMENVRDRMRWPVLRDFLRSIVNLVKVVIKFAVRVLGALVVASAVLGTVVLTFSAANGVFNASSVYFDFPLELVVQDSVYFALVVMVYLVLLIPLIFAGFIGAIAASWRKWTIDWRLAVVLGLVWFAAVTIGGVLAVRKAPAFIEAASTRPEWRITFHQ